MKTNQPDEEFQQNIERGIYDNSPDGRAYRRVFEALKQENYALPANFESRVMQRLESTDSLVAEYLWMGAGLFVFAIAGVIVLALVDTPFTFGIFKFLGGHTG